MNVFPITVRVTLVTLTTYTVNPISNCHFKFRLRGRCRRCGSAYLELRLSAEKFTFTEAIRGQFSPGKSYGNLNENYIYLRWINISIPGRIQDLWRGVRGGVRRFPERYFWAKVNVQIGIFHTNEWAKGGFDLTPRTPPGSATAIVLRYIFYCEKPFQNNKSL